MDPLSRVRRRAPIATVPAVALRGRGDAERRLQRGHEVAPAGARRRRCRDLAALGLAGDQLAHPVLDLVLVARRIERAVAEVVDDLAGEIFTGIATRPKVRVALRSGSHCRWHARAWDPAVRSAYQRPAGMAWAHARISYRAGTPLAPRRPMIRTALRAPLIAVLAVSGAGACSRPAPPPVMGPVIGESTAPGPSDPTLPPPDAAGVTETSVRLRGVPRPVASPAPADTTTSTPASPAQPVVVIPGVRSGPAPVGPAPSATSPTGPVTGTAGPNGPGTGNGPATPVGPATGTPGVTPATPPSGSAAPTAPGAPAPAAPAPTPPTTPAPAPSTPPAPAASQPAAPAAPAAPSTPPPATPPR